MGLTFRNNNDLDRLFDKFASVPDPKKTPKGAGKGKDAKDTKKDNKAADEHK
ncbi:SPJ_0845 family protein [Escherichia coli]|uniref:SPJ_0845 family protein n=1 Tax=Escherichia coli TaxID=562 RepID=UPI0010D08FD8|nr:SPJ_0845 family protein [Escherichia coli]GDL59616.1 hypothetical protein BvCmsKSNP101_01054 [Escherichia coli]